MKILLCAVRNYCFIKKWSLRVLFITCCYIGLSSSMVQKVEAMQHKLGAFESVLKTPSKRKIIRHRFSYYKDRYMKNHSHRRFFSTKEDAHYITPNFMLHGYTLVKNVLTTEEAFEIHSSLRTHFSRQAKSLGISLEDYFKCVNRWRSPSPLVEEIENFIKPKLMPYIQQLYGETAFLQKSDIVIKTKKSASVIPLHQDISYHPNDPYQVTSWTSLSKTTKNSGGLYLIPGSHIYGILQAINLITVDENNHDFLVTQRLGNAIDVETNPGDVILIDSKLWHGTKAYREELNQHDDIRVSIISRWKHPLFQSISVPQDSSPYNRKNAKNLILDVIKQALGVRESVEDDISLIDKYINKIKHTKYDNKLINLLEGLKINIQSNEKFFGDDLQGNLFKALKFYFYDKNITLEKQQPQKINHSIEVQRKEDHINICLQEDVQSGLKTGLEAIHFVHNALPEINYVDLDITTNFLGKTLQAPILISSMTGGTNRTQDINLRLAAAAQKTGIAMSVGSMRVLLKEPERVETFSIRHIAPDILLMANLGAVQLNYGVTPKDCQQLVDSIGANALVLHLNVLQELTQPEGNKNWGNLLPKIREVVNYLSVPVIIKEVGYGLSEKVAQDLISIGVKALDVAGSGGTSWSQVESCRSTNALQNRVANSFIDWGIPTLDSLCMIRRVSKDIPIIASGGIKSGIDGAKTLHMGANLFGLARPFLQAASISEKAVSDEIEVLINQLKFVMMCTGSQTLTDLKKAETRKLFKSID